MTDFVHLHNHSMASLLDGLPTPQEMVDRAKEIGQSAIAITDHGTMSGILGFYEYAKQQDIKPLIGIEAYFALDLKSREKTDAIYHMGLIAKSNKGLENLYRLSDIAWNRGFYKKPRIDHQTLEDYGEDLICLSGCMSGIISKAILEGDLDLAEFHTKALHGIFEDNFYIEIQPWNEPALNINLLKIADRFGIPSVATADSHYLKEEDKVAEEISLLMAQTSELSKKQKDIVYAKFSESRRYSDDLKRINFLHPDRKLRFDSIDNYVMTKHNLEKRMKEAGVDRQDIYENTVAIAEQCNVEIPLSQNYFPRYSKNLNSEEYLRDLAVDGLVGKGLTSDEYIDRLNEELDVVSKLQFCDYFLVIWDSVNWARTQGILTGPGRGSVGGSLLAYALNITRIDPIKHNLLFWRFLNVDESGQSARVEPPDIDMDFEDRRRDEVKEYLISRWKNVANISTFTEFKAKGMVRDISRVFGIPLREVNEVCKYFETLDEFLEEQKCESFRLRYPEVERLAKKFEGRWRNKGIHAAGMVVSNIELQSILPMESRSVGLKDSKRIPVVAYGMDDCWRLGLIKMDYLSVAALSVINDTLKEIKLRHGKSIDLDSLNLEDKIVLDEFSAGHTVGTFQTEAQPYTRLLKNMGVDNFNDLVASNALVRPGPLLTATKSYIARKHGEEKIKYLSDEVEAITKDTYGLFIYQEELIESLVTIGGFSWHEADKIRKIIGKKRDESEFGIYKDRWQESASKIIGSAAAKKLWNDFVKFAGYAFNKSHAAAYSLLSYQTMWLKKYYPAEYMHCLLKNEPEQKKITTFIFESKRLGLEIYPPDINTSDEYFSIDEAGNTRYGLGQVKGVGPAAAQEIIDKRPFDSYEDFLGKIERRKCNTKVISALNSVGAFKDLNGHETPENYEDNFYEYLGYPKDFALYDVEFNNFDLVEIEGMIPDQLNLIKVLVKKVEYKPTFTKIEVEDFSGSNVFFGDTIMSRELMREGEIIVAITYNNDMVDYMYVDEYIARENEAVEPTLFETFLNGDIFTEDQELYETGVGGLENHISLVAPIHIRHFKVKTGQNIGKKMAAFILIDEQKNITKVIVFPNSYEDVMGKIQLWKPCVVKLDTARDGTLVINSNGIRTVHEHKMYKGLI